MKTDAECRYAGTDRGIMFVSAASSFIITFTGSALSLAIPAIGEELNACAGETGWIITIYTLVAAAFSVPAGKIADVTSKKLIMGSGIAVFSFASLAGAFSKGIISAAAARGFQGFGASMIFATNQAILVDMSERSQRGRALGFSSAMTYLGLAAGPAAGGVINYYSGWRALFIFSFIISSAIMIPAVRWIPGENIKHKKGTGDVKGTLLFITSAFITTYALTSITEGLFPIFMALSGAGLWILFVMTERRTEHPLIDVTGFYNRPEYTLSVISAFINYGTTYAVSYLISLYLQASAGLDARGAGLILITAPVLQAVCSPFAGRLSDRISPLRLASSGMALITVSLFLFSFTGHAMYGIKSMIFSLMAEGVGLALFSSPNANSVMSCAGEEEYGVASSILASVRAFGNTAAMALINSFMRSNIGENTILKSDTAAMTETVRILFIIFAFISAAGLIMAAWAASEYSS